MTFPLVSVVIPTLNRARYVGEAVESVLNQEGCRVDVVVVDDGSTDGTGDVLSSFGDSIRVIRTAGVERGAARNLGVEHAHADLVAFLDSDDYWRPQKLSTQVPYLHQGIASITGVDVFDQSGRVVRVFEPSLNVYDGLTIANTVFAGPSSLALSKQDFLRVGGFPIERDVQGAEDWIFFLKLLRAGVAIVGVQEPLVRYRVHSDNSTADADRVAACMWATTRWIADHALVQGREVQRMRAHTASVIGRHFTFHRRWIEAGQWGRRALRQGALNEALKGCLWMLGSAIKAIFRRRARAS